MEKYALFVVSTQVYFVDSIPNLRKEYYTSQATNHHPYDYIFYMNPTDYLCETD